MIKLTNLQKIYRTKEIETVALENVNLEVQQGEFLSIMGPSGCGKSTLLNIMGLLDLPTSGTVEINGVNTVGMSDKELAIAGAIVGNPEIILADEPTGNLDSKMGIEVMDLLHQLNKEDGRTIVMVTHNEAQAKQTSRTVCFFDGRQVQ